MIRIISPVPYRVFQRNCPVKITFISDRDTPGCSVTVLDRDSRTVFEEKQATTFRDGMYYRTDVFLPAGGWYTVTVETGHGSDTSDVFGVGEVFVIAGQSHATNSNSRQFRINDPEGRITVYEPAYGTWRIAHDRQPCFDSSEYNARFGTFWPVAFDDFLEKTGLPVGMTNAAFGATALFQWMPGNDMDLFGKLVSCCKAVENFRAILWQQGESDVMWHTQTDDYVKGVIKLKTSLDAALGKNTEWLVAKSTIHPSAYDDPEHEKLIQDAVDVLWNQDGFYEGPDTDLLNGDCRDRGDFSGHMTEKGQRLAGKMWSESIRKYLACKGK